MVLFLSEVFTFQQFAITIQNIRKNLEIQPSPIATDSVVYGLIVNKLGVKMNCELLTNDEKKANQLIRISLAQHFIPLMVELENTIKMLNSKNAIGQIRSLKTNPVDNENEPFDRNDQLTEINYNEYSNMASKLDYFAKYSKVLPLITQSISLILKDWF